MVDYLHIAIADVLRHPSLGLVSHQPDLKAPAEDRIRVMNRNGDIRYVLASECTKDYTMKEYIEYWDAVDKFLCENRRM